MSTVNISRPELQISTRPAKLNITQRRPQLRIRHRRPKMEIRKQAPVFKIVRAASSAKTGGEPVPIVQISKRFTRAYTASNSTNFTERIVSYSADFGSDIASVPEREVKNSAMDMIAAENSKPIKQADTLSIEWERGYFEIDWTQNVMEINWDVDPYPEITVEPHDIEIYVKTNISRNQKKKVSHAFPGSQVDKKV